MSVQEAELVELISDLVRIDSVTPWLIPGAGGEAAIGRYISDWMSSAGADVSMDEVEPGRANVVASLPGSARPGTAGRSLILNQHIDTVGFANWPDRALRPTRDGDRLIGLGAADDKSSCAIAMLALREISRPAALSGDLVAAFTIDEEGSSIGTSHLVANHRADGAIVLEPEGVGRAVVEHQGFGWVDIVTTGRAAHGSAPELGIDAIAHMAEVVRGLSAMRNRFMAERASLSGSTVLHTSTISGGTDYATYPSECRLGIEIGTQPGEKLAVRIGEIEAVLDDCRARLPGFAARIEVKLERDPFQARGHERLLAAAHQATQEAAGVELAQVGLNAWGDAALMQAAGIPTILMGASGGNFHAPDEWVSVSECVTMVDIVERTAVAFCA